MVNKILKPALINLILFAALSCSTTEPIEDKPGRRDYVWTIDTVVSPTNYPYKTIYRLWGSSPTDLWATAGGGDPAAGIFHFDGEKWVSSADRYEGKYLIPWEPNSIYGFGPNDVYIGCEAGRIYHYDGSGMKEIAALTKDGHTDIVFNNMWGELPLELFGFGAYPDDQLLFNGSIIGHLINNKWTMLNTDGLEGIVAQLYRNKTNSEIYLQVIKYSNSYDTTFIYQYDDGQFIKLYSTIWSSHWASISLISNEVYFVLNTEIAKRINNQFKSVLKLDNTNFYERIWGRNSKDIFLEMTDGLAHYNGIDIKYLFQYSQSNVSIFDSAIFDNDVFFLLYEFQTGLSLIYHGKLK